MTTVPAPSQEASLRTARRVSGLLDPVPCLALVTVLTGWHAERVNGIRWGLFAALFTVAIPLALNTAGRRLGYWDSRHLPRLKDRLLLLPASMASVAVGLATMFAIHAPTEMTALLIAMLCCAAVVLGITTVWKVSLHTSVAAGTLAVLTLAYGPPTLVLAPLIPLLGWSRVRLNAHTPGQTIVGAVLGTVLGGLVFALLR
ncbi:phosphatase PAP2 family protein [Streptomyces sp. NPDC101194]|uniref:phosphatase PAP2 family protein n=1 Tax=Streptomyces sp. NPDC101194 TaxID=3366127 RepID=UPI0037F2D05E